MAEEDVGSIVVLEDDAPVGVITDRAIALALAGTPDIADRKVDEFISGEIVTGNVDMTVLDAIDRLENNGIRRLPIVDDDGTLEGIVTLDDILVLLGDQLVKATSIIRMQSPRV
jgi:CBS domain-containing protein